MSTQVIETQWDNFEKKVLPIGASDIQRIEMKRSFYAGATSIIMVLTQSSDEQSDDLVAGILQEINNFSNAQILMDKI